ncbi:SH3 domain-containing protein [Sulfurimonas sp. SAG-AH-194-I05]|nr:SH3 domain-containing protein [Sulfurimonas sp. SAG-AH-194-I05]MDF1875795.1 SH3 domain-containing protein [Sulfurimonas sp. SAG-AH-194-I05]
MYDPTANLFESLDPMRKFNEDMKRITDPMYEINKALDPMHSINESLTLATQPLVDSISEFQKRMEYIYDPMKKINEHMESMFDPFKKIQEQMDSLYSLPDLSFENPSIKAVQQLQDSLNLALGSTSLHKYNDLVSSQMESYKKMEKALSSAASSVIQNPFRSVDSVIEKILERENVIQAATQNPTPDDALAEFTSMKDEILESLDGHHLKVEEQLEKIYILLESLKNPLLLAFFVSFIFPIIINNISNAIYDNVVKPAIASSRATKVQLKKEVNRNVKSVLSHSGVIGNYRIVSVNTLNVRKNHSTKSKIIGYTFFGEVVEIIEKKRNWCLIKRYDSESETYVQGWVFTRYLGRIT